MKDRITPNLLKLARLFKKKGELYVVGGYVRNALLGIYETDIDLASKLTNEEIKELLFGTKYEVKETSKKLGTLVISLGEEKWEHTTFRREEYAPGGEHVPVKVEFIDSIEEDAKRRDFTVNAIYYNILKDEIVDFYDGVKDVRKRIIRTVETPDYVFANDGLRILRMIRLASELGFSINGETLVAAYEMRENLNAISGLRKLSELNLILNSPSRYKVSRPNAHIYGLQIFNMLRLWKYYNSPVLKIRLNFVKKVKPELRFVALLIDIIASSKYKNDHAELVNQILGKSGLSLQENKVEYYKHIVCGYYDAIAKKENKEFFIEYFEDFPIISQILEKKSLKLFKKYNFFYNYLKNNKIPIRLKDLKITGLDIKNKYPKIKEKYYTVILTQLLSMVFDGLIKNEKEALLEAVAKIKA